VTAFPGRGGVDRSGVDQRADRGRMSTRSEPPDDGSGSPRLLLIFTASVLSLVAGIALIGLTDSDWAVGLALALTLALLCVALRELLASMREEDDPPR
jgi:hypothetical protein